MTETSASRNGIDVAAVIVNYRTPDLAWECVEALARERDALPGLKAYIADGGSGDDSVEVLNARLAASAHGSWVSIMPLGINGGYGWANNQVMLTLLQGATPPRYFHILNPDSIVAPGAVTALVDALEADPSLGIAGSQLIDPDGGMAGSTFRFPSIARELARGAGTPAVLKPLGVAPLLIEPGKSGPAEWVTGASFMLRGEALKQTGLFDDGFFLYFEEIELMHRFGKAGWGIVHVAESRVTHLGGAATGVNDHAAASPPRPRYWYESRRRFFTRVRGGQGALLATMAWSAGRLLAKLRQAFSAWEPYGAAANEFHDVWAAGACPTPSDFINSAADWTSRIGTPPAWWLTKSQGSIQECEEFS